MRVPFFLFIALAASASQAQVRLALSVGGKAAGTAVLSQHLTADGGKMVDLRIEMSMGTRKAQLTSQTTYDAKANPVRKFLETIVPGGQVQHQTIASFDPAGANVVVRTGDGRITKKVPLVATPPRACSSEFWFVRDRPKPGQVVKSYSFNPDTLAWDLTETVYVGLKSVTVRGKKYQAHEVNTEQGDRHIVSYLDDKGLPLMVDDGSMLMERIADK